MSTYAQPLAYWIAAIVGLIMSLLTDGWGDLLGLCLIASPMLAVLRASFARRRDPETR